MAIVDQRILNSYAADKHGQQYKEGDLAVRFPECSSAGPQACETEARQFDREWRAAFKSS